MVRYICWTKGMQINELLTMIIQLSVRAVSTGNNRRSVLGHVFTCDRCGIWERSRSRHCECRSRKQDDQEFTRRTFFNSLKLIVQLWIDHLKIGGDAFYFPIAVADRFLATTPALFRRQVRRTLLDFFTAGFGFRQCPPGGGWQFPLFAV